MNNTRRKKIKLAIGHIQTAQELLECVKDEEENAMDNIPENLQETDRYSAMEDTVDALDTAIDDIASVLDTLNEVVGS